MTDLDRIERYCAEATPGAWKWWTSNSWKRLKRDDYGIAQNVAEPYVCRDGHPDLTISDEDMRFIANARRDLPALVQRCRELEAALRDAEPHIGLVRHGFGDEVRAIRRHVNALLTFIPNEDANG